MASDTGYNLSWYRKGIFHCRFYKGTDQILAHAQLVASLTGFSCIVAQTPLEFLLLQNGNSLHDDSLLHVHICFTNSALHLLTSQSSFVKFNLTGCHTWLILLSHIWYHSFILVFSEPEMRNDFKNKVYLIICVIPYLIYSEQV